MCRFLGFLVSVAFQMGIYAMAQSNGWQVDSTLEACMYACGIANITLVG